MQRALLTPFSSVSFFFFDHIFLFFPVLENEGEKERGKEEERKYPRATGTPGAAGREALRNQNERIGRRG